MKPTLLLLGKSYNLAERYIPVMGKQERTMPICLTPEELNLLELYARKKGMLNAAQAIEGLLAK